MDGGTKIAGLWDEANGCYYFNDAMGDLTVYVYVVNAEQHKAVIATRKNENVVYYVTYAPDAAEGNLLFEIFFDINCF